MSRPRKNPVEAPKKSAKETAPISKIRGFKDVLPEEYKYWNLVFKKATELAKVYSFRRVDLPILENQALFDRAGGKTSDFISEELCSFCAKGGEKVGIRPDVLPSLVRSFVEHGVLQPGQISKSFWLGPVLSYDSSQGSRPRQYNQASFDFLGDFGYSADAQLILIAYNFFKELQLDVEVQLNCVGCPECRGQYLKELNEAFKERGRKSKLCNDCKKHLLKNPLRIFDCHEESCSELATELPPVIDHLCDACHKHFERILEFMDNLSIPYSLNTKLFFVRGYDFWQRVVYEIMPAGETRRHLSLASGGNYPELVSDLGGKSNAACGIAMDLERTISRIRSHNIAVDCGEKVDIFIAQLSENAKQKCMTLFEELRKAGFKVREHFISDSLKGQLDEAERIKAKFSLILGQKEMMDNTILLRDMESGVQETIDIRKLAAELDRRLNII